MSSENRTERERVISELSTTTTKMVTAAAAAAAAATISIVHFNCLTSPLSSLSLGVAPNMANTHRGGKRERHRVCKVNGGAFTSKRQKQKQTTRKKQQQSE